MMKKLLPMLLASTLVCSVNIATAAPQDNAPPAHQQKNQVPDTTQNGNYLEQQQDNNNDTKGSANTQQQNSTNKPSKAGNMEKSKRFHQKPDEGGTGVKQP
ncbi:MULTISPECIES: hypothetical protein [Methylophilus]|uniref:hypothetical protein n=1 Tax=Methylophilus TaxID=16 RepID=UPI0003A28265|nr:MULTISPECIES: hypothetical protein [Methylophilus]